MRRAGFVVTTTSIAAFAFAIFALRYATAAPAADTAEAHIAAATAAAGQDLKSPLRLCTPAQGGAPARVANNTAEPAKIFDNLYFIGIPSVSAWAITTSAGLIVIDSLDNPRESQTFIEGGLKKLGLDPNEIKYLIITHAHNDHFGGAQYLADKFHATLVMSDTDWGTIEHMQPPPEGNTNRGPLPRRGMSVKDGDKITLGDTTVEIYQTPPHTPGAISLIIPLKEGNQRHVAAFVGGLGFNFPQSEQNYTTYANSYEKLANVARERGADVLMANHSTFDDAFRKIELLKARRPGQPNPFVLGADTVQRVFTVQEECAMAGRARLRAASAR
jgi:metallo-beta-lactamase class B